MQQMLAKKDAKARGHRLQVEQTCLFQNRLSCRRNCRNRNDFELSRSRPEWMFLSPGTVSAKEEVVQRKLFVGRTEEEEGKKIKEKNVEEMAEAVKVGRRRPQKGKSKVKRPQYIGTDTKYQEYTSENEIINGKNGYTTWRQNCGFRIPPDEKVVPLIQKKIRDMISKKVRDRNVEYYFDSREELFRYLYLYESKLRGEDGANQTPNLWVKINVVNTGAGDAIVMALPAGYLILDLGTNMNILSEYLSLRKNKRREETGGESRGIPFWGSESVVVITHNHADHRGFKRSDAFGSFLEKPEVELIVGYGQYCELKARNDSRVKRLERLLSSGDFWVCNFQDNGCSRENADSIVICRINESEAIFLCGDQEPSRLVSAVGNTERKPRHVFVKVPHHGSSENNTPEVFDAWSRLGVTADFFISSGKLYEHPTAGAFLNSYSLLPQGTEIRYCGRRPLDGENESDRRISGRVYFTANLNARVNEIAVGSVVYKSNGQQHAAYSKLYKNGENSGQNETYVDRTDSQRSSCRAGDPRSPISSIGSMLRDCGR